MKNITTIFTSAVLIMSMFVFTANAADKENSYVQIGKLNKLEQKAQKKVNAFVQAVELNDVEKGKLFELLLEEQKLFKTIKKENKGNKSAYKEAIKPLKAQTEIDIAAIIGSEKMDLYLESRVK